MNKTVLAKMLIVRTLFAKIKHDYAALLFNMKQVQMKNPTSKQMKTDLVHLSILPALSPRSFTVMQFNPNVINCKTRMKNPNLHARANLMVMSSLSSVNESVAV